MRTKKENQKVVTSSSSSVSSSSESRKEKCILSSEEIKKTIAAIIERDRIDVKQYKEEFDNQIKDQLNNIEGVRKQIEKVKIDFIAVIGIFVSIFTFISIEIQILRYVHDFFRIAGFSLIIFGSLTGFIILLHSIFSEKKVKWSIWCLCILLFLLGILFGSIPYFIEIQYLHCFLIN